MGTSLVAWICHGCVSSEPSSTGCREGHLSGERSTTPGYISGFIGGRRKNFSLFQSPAAERTLDRTTGRSWGWVRRPAQIPRRASPPVDLAKSPLKRPSSANSIYNCFKFGPTRRSFPYQLLPTTTIPSLPFPLASTGYLANHSTQRTVNDLRDIEAGPRST